MLKGVEIMALEKGDFRFEITEHIAVIGTNPATLWTKELNVVKWNDARPKLDIREWDPEHEHCGRGITMNEAEGKELVKALCERFEN